MLKNLVRQLARLSSPAVAVSAALCLLLQSGCDAGSAGTSAATTNSMAAATIAAPGSPASGDWSRFRGPAGDGSSTATGLPVTWSATENIAWKTPLTGAGASSPIVWQDRVYLTYYSGYFVPDAPGGSLDDLERHLMAINLADGSVLWDQSVPAKLPEEQQIRDHGYAANTPLADADHVYVFFGKSGVFAFNHAGEQQWQADVGGGTNGWGTSASPVLAGDLLIINASVESESLVALDRRTGEERWRAGGIREAWNTPLLVKSASGREELVVAIFGEILAFEPQSGKPLWSCKTDITWYMAPSLIAHEGILYCLGGRSGVASLAVKTGGSGDVTRTHRLWTTNEGSNVSSPVYHDGHLYFMNDQRETAYCLRAEDGETVYEKRLDRAGQVYASSLLADGRVYHLSRDGKTFVLAATPEFEQLAVNDLRDGGVFNGSPAVAGQRLLIRSDKFLYCIGQ